MLQVWRITRKFSGAQVIVPASSIADLYWFKSQMLRSVGKIGIEISGFHKSPNYSKVVRASNFELSEWSAALDVLRFSDFEFEKQELNISSFQDLEKENKKLADWWLRRINDFFVTE
jgi:hypothetical protein